MTYNIHSGFGRDKSYNLERTIQVIKNETPDIVALQEVDRNLSRSNFDDQSRIIADALDMNYVHCVNRYLQNGEFGITTLSRFPVLHEKRHDLSYRPYMEPRGTLRTDLQISKEECLHVFNVHLGLSRRERQYQRNRLLSKAILLDHSLHDPVVVLGDFNDRLFSVVHSELQDQFKDTFNLAGEERGSTFRWGPIKLRLDHIYINHQLHPQKTYVVNTPLSRITSDHLPLMTVVEADFPRNGH